MVHNSTLVYVLENLEEKSEEVFNIDEVLDFENSQIQNLFEIIDRTIEKVSPEVIQKILQTASIL